MYGWKKKLAVILVGAYTLLLAFFPKILLVRGVPNVGIVSVLCGRTVPDLLDPYLDALESLTFYIKRDTARNNYNFGIHLPDGNGLTCYARGVCSLVLSHGDCRVCLETAESIVVMNCGLTFGAQANLVDCRFTYDTYPV